MAYLPHSGSHLEYALIALFILSSISFVAIILLNFVFELQYGSLKNRTSFILWRLYKLYTAYPRFLWSICCCSPLPCQIVQTLTFLSNKFKYQHIILSAFFMDNSPSEERYIYICIFDIGIPKQIQLSINSLSRADTKSRKIKSYVCLFL